MAASNSSPSGFSYAQAAAKARPSATTSQTPPSKVTSGTTTPANGTFSELGPNSNWADDVEATEGDKTTEMKKNVQEQGKSSQAKDSAVERTKSESRVQNGSSGVSSPDLTASSSTTNTDDASSAPSGTSSSETTWETKSQNSEPAWIAERKERQSSHPGEEGKGKRGKKESKEAKEAKESTEAAIPQPPPKPVVLHDAPPPPVNPWAKRMETAKSKSVAPAPTQPTPKPAPQASQAQSTLKENQNPKGDSRKKANSVVSVARETESQATGDAKKSTGAQGKRADQVRPKSRQGSKPGIEESRADSAAAPGRAAQREHQSMPNLTSMPPPVKDESSWPTPESAQDKERKEAAAAEKEATREADENGDAEAASAGKPREKTKWKPVPVTPSIVWQTEEMNRPPRGSGERSGRGGAGRGRGGFRGAPNGAKGAERASTRGNGSPEDGESSLNGQRGRSDTVDREAMPPPPKPRASSASGSRVDRKAREQSFSGRQKFTKGAADVSSGSENTSASPFTDARRSKSPSKVDAADGRDVKIPEPIPRHSPIVESQHDSSREGEMAREVSAAKAGDGKRESRSFDVPNGKDWNGAPPRGGKRNGRGRGGSREFINGGHQANQMFTNGHAIEFAGGNPFAVPASPSAYQSTRGQFSFNQGRGGWARGNPRSQSIPVDTPYGARNQPYWPPQQLAPVQPYYPNMYDYPAPMSAVPYHPMVEQHYLMDMVSTQLEYYFSIDNLIKDMYLRRNMDSQGYVFLDIIANFNRIKQLTTDKDMLKAVCLRSDNIEIRVGDDGKDRLRRHQGWEQFLLPTEQRDPSAQTEGPQNAVRPEHPPLHIWSPPASFRGPQSAGMSGAQRRSYDSGYAMNGTVPPFAPFNPMGENPFGEMPNGDEMRGRATKSPIRDHSTSPTHQAIAHATEAYKDTEPDVFPDEQAGTLTVVVKMNQQRTHHHAASRTFSNGSIDTRSVFGEMDKSVEPPTTNGEPVVNGDKGSPSLTRISSPGVGRSPEKSNGAAELMLLWVKDKEVPQDNLPQDATLEPYVQLHRKALDQRQQAATGTCPYDLDVLYQFWSHFLIRNFNRRMYAEFKGLAHGDADERHNGVGLQNLVQFYAKALASTNPIRDHVVNDYVQLVKNEPQITSNLAFKQLRQAWRNGALNLKNRKKLADIVDESLRARLES